MKKRKISLYLQNQPPEIIAIIFSCLLECERWNFARSRLYFMKVLRNDWTIFEKIHFCVDALDCHKNIKEQELYNLDPFLDRINVFHTKTLRIVNFVVDIPQLIPITKKFVNLEALIVGRLDVNHEELLAHLLYFKKLKRFYYKPYIEVTEQLPDKLGEIQFYKLDGSCCNFCSLSCKEKKAKDTKRCINCHKYFCKKCSKSCLVDFCGHSKDTEVCQFCVSIEGYQKCLTGLGVEEYTKQKWVKTCKNCNTKVKSVRYCGMCSKEVCISCSIWSYDDHYYICKCSC